MNSPEIMEMIRESAFEETVETGRYGIGRVFFRSFKEIFKSFEIRLRRSISLIVFTGREI
jgi:hypothetical protein